MLQVRDIMTRDVIALDPHSTLRDAVELLAQRHVSGVPVLSGESLVGVLSASDVLAFQASTPGVPAERPALELEEWDESTEWVEGEAPPAAFFSEQWSDANRRPAAPNCNRRAGRLRTGYPESRN